jgi:Transglutaminase-like superfamily
VQVTAGVLLDDLITQALHGVAWVALRVQSPVSAMRTVTRIGASVRPFANLADARSGARRLWPTGSCLSRSLAISARLRGSSVVIGVDPRWSPEFRAHAWVALGAETIDGAVEIDGAVLGGLHDAEIARL